MNIKKWKIDTREEFIDFIKNFHKNEIYDFFDSIEEKENFINEHKNNSFLKENLINFVLYKHNQNRLSHKEGEVVSINSFFHRLFSFEELIKLHSIIGPINSDIIFELQNQNNIMYEYLTKRDFFNKDKLDDASIMLNGDMDSFIKLIIEMDSPIEATMFASKESHFKIIIENIFNKEQSANNIDEFASKLANNFYYTNYIKEIDFRKNIKEYITNALTLKYGNDSKEIIRDTKIFSTILGVNINDFDDLNLQNHSINLSMRLNPYFIEYKKELGFTKNMENSFMLYRAKSYSKESAKKIFEYFGSVSKLAKYSIRNICYEDVNPDLLIKDFHLVFRSEENAYDIVNMINFSKNDMANKEILRLDKSIVLFSDIGNLIDDSLFEQFLDRLTHEDEKLMFLISYNRKMNYNMCFFKEHDKSQKLIVNMFTMLKEMSDRNKNKLLGEGEFSNILFHIDIDYLKNIATSKYKQISTLKTSSLALGHFGSYISKYVCDTLNFEEIQNKIIKQKIQDIELIDYEEENSNLKQEQKIRIEIENMLKKLIAVTIKNIDHLVSYNENLSFNKNLTKENLVQLYNCLDKKSFIYYSSLEENLTKISDILYFCCCTKFDLINDSLFKGNKEELKDFNNKSIEYKYIKEVGLFHKLTDFIITNTLKEPIDVIDIQKLIENGNYISNEIINNTGPIYKSSILLDFDF